MHESDRIRAVHKHLSPSVNRFKIQANFNNGIADCYYVGKSDCLWIEYKQISFPKRDSTRIKPNLSELQKKFLIAHLDAGLNAWVVVFSDKGHFILKNFAHWKDGIPAKHVRPTLKPYKDIAHEILQAVS